MTDVAIASSLPGAGSAQRRLAIYQKQLKEREFDRLPIKLVLFGEQNAAKQFQMPVVEGEWLKPKSPKSNDTIFVVNHPEFALSLHPLPRAFAKAGYHTMCTGLRFPGRLEDLCLEEVLIDVGAFVRHCKNELKFKRVILVGICGGGAVASFYQAEAENPTITETPAGDPINMKEKKLIPADGLVLATPHIGRAQMFTEQLDAAVTDEVNPLNNRSPQLDAFHPQFALKPPFPKPFQNQYAQAQVARNHRITKWAKQQLATWKEQPEVSSTANLHFYVHGVRAGLFEVDATLQPNKRELKEVSFIRKMNMAVEELACSVKTWLSLYSLETTNGNGPKNIRRVKCPVVIVEHTADDRVPPNHPHAYFDNIQHNKKKLLQRPTTHYDFATLHEQLVPALDALGLAVWSSMVHHHYLNRAPLFFIGRPNC
eukprot:TRINITY_DN76406_c0_g1_i1.p1 TRINITY_DN76406_c0_g1~~TRINITY_DN76406_c0_g1_i1.p1  ORF type:complete len:439 (+),score=52.33 TRINITY_DN76406_c0_g1_i1:38-1318(+)